MSGNEPNPAGTEQSGKWKGQTIPRSFAGKDTGYVGPRQRTMKQSTRSPTPKSEHVSLATTATDDATDENEHGGESIGGTGVIQPHPDDHTDPTAFEAAILDEQSYEGENTENFETESLMEEESHTLEDDEMPFSVADNNMTESSFPQDLAQELADAGEESDEEDENDATAGENNLPVDLSQSSLSISSDGAMDAASETGKYIVDSNNGESNPNPEANIDEILAERDSLRKKIESQNERMEAMRQENVSLREQLGSRREIISAQEAEIAALKKSTVKAIPSADVTTNTETPVSSLAAQKATATRFVQPFLVIAKDLYSDFTEAVNGGPTLSSMAYFFRKWAQAVVTFLATLFWMLMNFSVYVSIQHEKNLWMQANALTRKKLLSHVSGATGEWSWDTVLNIGSMILLYYVHL